MSNEKLGKASNDAAKKTSAKGRKPKDLPKPLLAAIAVIIVGAMLAAYFVWPTPWAYYNNGAARYRQSRWSGGTQVWNGTDWIDS